MIPANFYDYFKNDYDAFKTLLDSNMIRFEMPFDHPGSQTTLAGKKIVSFASNDYLSMMNHPDVTKAAIEAIKEYGTGAGSSMLGSGSLLIHKQLQEELADFLGKEAVLLFPTGFSAMLGFGSMNIINGSKIFYDSEAHRSIIDGMNLGAGLAKEFDASVAFKHNSLSALEKKYTKLKNPHGYNTLFVEGIYSMSGDMSKLDELLPFCETNNLVCAVDDAHGIGVVGKNGKGVANHYNLTDKTDFILGTMSKTFAGSGGFIAGPKEELAYIRLLCGVYMFSASMLPSSVMVARKILKIMQEDDSYRLQLQQNIKRMKNGLTELGFDTGESQAAVIPVYIRDTEKLTQISNTLLDNGIFALASMPPAVAEGQQLIRVSINRAHTEEQIDLFLDTLDNVANKVGLERKR